MVRSTDGASSLLEEEPSNDRGWCNSHMVPSGQAQIQSQAAIFDHPIHSRISTWETTL